MDCGFNAAIVNSGSHFIPLTQALNPIKGQDTIKVNMIPWFNWFVENKEPEEMPGYMDEPLRDYRKYAKPGNRTPITSWMLHDEPAYYQFDRHKLFFHAMAQHDTTRMTWENLIGDCRAQKTFLYYTVDVSAPGDTSISIPIARKPIRIKVSLRRYIEDFCKEFRPGVLSYDYYPFAMGYMKKEDPQYKKDSLVDVTIEKRRLDDFYTALQLYSEISKKRNRPFWAFCQSKATCVDDEYKPKEGHPAPTEDYLRYEAFNALAFGAQGIQYWSYKESDVPAEKPEGKYYALATKDGEKTPAWEFARKVNHEIKSWTNVFLGAKLDSYYFVGDPRDTTYCDYRRGSSAKAISVMDTNPGDTVGSNRGALVSTLVNGEDNYVVIVNQSPYEPVSLELWLNESEYTIIGLRKSEALPMSNGFPVKPGDVSVVRKEDITLAPAQYAIYSYRKKSASGN